MEEAKEVTTTEILIFVGIMIIMLTILIVTKVNEYNANDFTMLACNMSYEALNNESFCTQLTLTNNLDQCFDKIENYCNISIRPPDLSLK